VASLLIPQGFSCIYWSQLDEAAFFSWLEAIPGVVRVVGVGNELVVTLRSSRISFAAMRELIALHVRYNLTLRGLAQFKTPKNKALFKVAGRRQYVNRSRGLRSNYRIECRVNHKLPSSSVGARGTHAER